MRGFGRVHVEVGSARGFPVVGDIEEESGDEAEEGFRVREDADDSGSAFDFLAETLGGVGGAQAWPVFFWETEDGEAFWDVFLEPGGEFWSGFAVFGDHGFELGLGMGKRLGAEDLAQLGGDGGL